MKIVLVGAGNLSTHLGKALQEAHHNIVQVYSRTEASAVTLAHQLACSHTTDLQALSRDADIYIYALKDDIVQQVMNEVNIPNALHLHTAGSIPLHCKQEGRYGVMYPLQTFSKERPVNFQEIPIFIEGDSEDTLQTIHQLAYTISQSIYTISSQQRQQLHLAAIFACNFVNCMYANAAELLRDIHLPFDVLMPLIQETASKVRSLTPEAAQTGPAKRYDKNILQQHIDKLSSPNQQAIYRLLSEDIHQRHLQAVPAPHLEK